MTKNHADHSIVKFDFVFLDSCPSCESEILIPNGKIDWLDIDFWYHICGSCGLKFMNPRPTMKSYREFYKNQFWQQKIRNLGFKMSGQLWNGERYKYDDDNDWSPEYGIENLIKKVSELRSSDIINTLQQHITISKNTNILEIGCGFAATLHIIKQKFKCNCFAIEPSDEAISFIEDKGIIELIGQYAEDLESISLSDTKYDSIIFSHVLENTVDPISVLKAAKKCLSADGIIYIQTPNLYICDQMNPYHPYVFSNASLKRIIEKAGLKYKRISKPIDRMVVAVCEA